MNETELAEVPIGLHPSRLERMRGHRFSLLLIFLLGSLPFYPYAESHGPIHYVFRFTTTIVTLLTVWAAAFRRGLFALMLVLAIPVVLQHTVFSIEDASVLSLVDHMLGLLFDLMVIAIIFRHVFTRAVVETESLIGAVCVYLLIGYSFAGLYGTIFSRSRHAFYLDPLTNLHRVPDRFDFLYFSFGTLTELGSPGITPVAPVARAVSLFEAVLGVLYLAVLISRLMSGFKAAREKAGQ